MNHIITFGCQEYSLTENSNVDSPIISGGKVFIYPLLANTKMFFSKCIEKAKIYDVYYKLNQIKTRPSVMEVSL